MQDWLDLLKPGLDLAAKGEPVALVTLVSIEGSSYKGLGARMLVDLQGKTYGFISGGCLEADVALHALECLKHTTSKIICYDSRHASDLLMGLGLGCEGVIELLIDSLKPHQALALFGQLADLSEKNTPGLVTTCYRREIHRSSLDILYVLQTQSMAAPTIFGEVTQFPVISETVQKAWEHQSFEAQSSPRSKRYTLSNQTHQFHLVCQPLLPPPRVLICGSGYDVQPMVQMAHFLGWPVHIFYSKSLPLHLGQTSDCLTYHPQLPQNAVERDALTKGNIAIIMSHNFERDRAFLEQIAKTEIAYIGLLGPKKRGRKLLKEATVSQKPWPHFFFPIGLDIGAQTPQEIALAVFAEIKAFYSHRSAKFLKDRQGPIHNRTP